MAEVIADLEKREHKDCKHFEAPLCSFEQLVNVASHPTPLPDVLQRLKEVSEGRNFTWDADKAFGVGYGAAVNISFEYLVWFPEQEQEQLDKKTNVSTTVAFLHKDVCLYVYQPVIPLVSLKISPRPSYEPMFEMDGRTFHTVKIAWRKYLDFGVVDYRLMVGENLQKWTQQCKATIEKPMDATYWLMLMVGSYYRETLVARKVVRPTTQVSDRVQVMCVDSFAALSSLLFAQELQILYGGVDATGSYLQWLAYIADQFSGRRSAEQQSEPCTQFEMNEFLDLQTMVVCYGRKRRKINSARAGLSWVGNPQLVKSYICKFAEDNKCACQVEQAVRLYTQSCSLGKQRSTSAGREAWYCWNGMSVCELGVPMPCTKASFLFPFTTTKQVAMTCSKHGPDCPPPKPARKAAAVQKKVSRARLDSTVSSMNSGGSKAPEGDAKAVSRSASICSRQSSKSERDTRTSSEASSEGDSQSVTSAGSGDEADAGEKESNCTCKRYIRGFGKEEATEPADGSVELLLQDFDLMHCFAAVLAGGLNLAKQVMRLHFSIDPGAYANLPMPAKSQWKNGILGWYREFHRSDAHGRSRYSRVLESVLRGLLGDGYTGGLLCDSLDILRLKPETKQQEPVRKVGTETVRKSPAPHASQLSQASQVSPTGTRRAENPANVFGGFKVPMSMLKSGVHRARMQVLLGSGAKDADEDTPLNTLAQMHTGLVGSHEQTTQNVMSDIAMWVDRCESKSIFGHRGHFQSFAQWCHTAHLIPFLRRVYRRCGVAGLAADHRSGRYKHGVDPSHPLVLPTMSDFCYGHCYPLHRVLQYFYGGVDRLMCSIDDPREADVERNTLGLIAGQERLNNQCWFRPATAVEDCRQLSHRGREETAQAVRGVKSHTKSDLEMTRTSSTSSVRRITGGQPPPVSAAGRQSTRVSLASHLQGRRSSLTSAVIAAPGLQPRSASRRPHSGSHSNDARSEKGPGHAKSAKVPRQPPKLGELIPTDPFFWFCQQNFAIYTYPANMMPRNFFNDPRTLANSYADFISRAGSPEPPQDQGPEVSFADRAERDEWSVEDDAFQSTARPLPPSICLCQRTEMSSHVRERWEVKKDMVDEKGIILGDTGLFPGAYNYRFTFEMKADNVDGFVRSLVVPQAQLLYLQYSERPSRAGERRGRGVSGSDHASPSAAHAEQDGGSHRGRLPSIHHRRGDGSSRVPRWDSVSSHEAPAMPPAGGGTP